MNEKEKGENADNWDLISMAGKISYYIIVHTVRLIWLR